MFCFFKVNKPNLDENQFFVYNIYINFIKVFDLSRVSMANSYKLTVKIPRYQRKNKFRINYA